MKKEKNANQSEKLRQPATRGACDRRGGKKDESPRRAATEGGRVGGTEGCPRVGERTREAALFQDGRTKVRKKERRHPPRCPG